MKRSDMIKEISQYIHDRRRATQSWTTHEIAEGVLDLIENAGMMPPQRQKALPGYDYMFDEPVTLFRHVNDWEPEDE